MMHAKTTSSSAAIAGRPRCRVGQFWPKWKTIGLLCRGSIFNHCDVIGLQGYRIRWKKAKWGLLHRSRSYKVTDVGSSEIPCATSYYWLILTDILLVLFWSYRKLLFRFRRKNGHFAFLSPAPFVRLGSTYTVHLRPIVKLVVDSYFC